MAAMGAAALAATLAQAPQAQAVTPIPGRLFVLADDGGNRGDLFRTNTSNEWVRLTTGLSAPESVSADPKGRFATLCARANGAAPYRIYRVSATPGGGRLKNLIGKRLGCSPSVSPDGRKVAFLSYAYTPGAKSKLMVVSAKGGRPKAVYTYCGGCITGGPFWGGKRLYFQRTVTRNPSADREIYSVRARDGKRLRKQTRSGANVDYRLLDVSADGRRFLAVIYDTSGLAVFTTALLKPSGALVQAFSAPSSDDLVAGGAFLPGGRRVATASAPVPGDPNQIELREVGGLFATIFPNPSVSATGTYAIDWSKRP